MTQLDSSVTAALDAAKAGEFVRLLVTCEGSCDSVIGQLNAANVAIANTIAELPVIVLEARKRDLEALRGLTGVVAIELEGEEHALE